MPLFSVIVPTRDRPNFLEKSLMSLLNQTFKDFEVIVCDNYTKNSSKQVFDKHSDQRFKYIKPSEGLPMALNWEYACSQATGIYVLVLIDKTVLFPNCLETLREIALKFEYPEVISFWGDMFNLNNPDNLDKGSYRPFHKTYHPKLFIGKEILNAKISFEINRATEGTTYYYGKICFGVYHKDLYKRILEKTGNIFYELSPDYTSMIQALSLGNSFVDAGQPLLMSYGGTGISNGANCATYPKLAKAFIQTYKHHQEIISDLPISGLYSSIHNIVAYDYKMITKKLEIDESFRINKVNLLKRAFYDLLNVDWQGDVIEKNSQWQIFNQSFRQLPFQTKTEFIALYFEYLKDNIVKLIKNVSFLRAIIIYLKRKSDSGYLYGSYNFSKITDALNVAVEYYQKGKLIYSNSKDLTNL